MYVSRIPTKTKAGKLSHMCILLRESYREEGKVKNKTILNLTHFPKKDVHAIELALKHKDNLDVLGSVETIKLQQTHSVGAVYVLKQISDRLGVTRALGYSENGKLALWQVIARTINQGSRLSAVRLAKQRNLSVLGMKKGFNEDALYKNLKWISNSKEHIEDKLFKIKFGKKKPKLFLYDVTSSYLEGDKNEYAEYGYNRDKKKGKKQIVIGLLCEEDGTPVATEIFEGNTSDTKTLANQIKTVAKRFGCKKVTFVGDKGMIKSTGIEELEKYGFSYITSISKQEIRTLMKKGVVQMELFEDELFEVEDKGIRYVLRRNTARKEEIMKTRRSKVESVEQKIREKNEYLRNHEKADEKVAASKIQEQLEKLRLSKWVRVKVSNRVIEIEEDKKVLEKLSLLDGCYVIKSDLEKKEITAEGIHEKYKSLSRVENAFRTMKQSHLEIRPVYVRKRESTKGHVLVVMLAYMIVQYLREAWKDTDVTVEEGIKLLDQICEVTVNLEEGGKCSRIPKPRGIQTELLDKIGVTLPAVLPSKNNIFVDSRKKLKNNS